MKISTLTSVKRVAAIEANLREGMQKLNDMGNVKGVACNGDNMHIDAIVEAANVQCDEIHFMLRKICEHLNITLDVDPK